MFLYVSVIFTYLFQYITFLNMKQIYYLKKIIKYARQNLAPKCFILEYYYIAQYIFSVSNDIKAISYWRANLLTNSNHTL